MSSNVYARPLRLEWRESPWLKHYTDLVHLLALAALLLPIAWPRPLLAGLAFAVGFSWLAQRYWLAKRRHRQMTGTWIWRADGVWVHERTGGASHWWTQTPAVVLPWLISLRLRNEAGQRRRLLLSVDSVPADTWRQLQVRLREWARTGHGDQSAR